MDSSFLKLNAGSSRITNWIGLQMEQGYQPVHGKGYQYLEIPVLGVYVEPSINKDGEESEGSYTKIVKRGQSVFVCAAGTIDVKGMYMVEIEPNHELSEYGVVQGLRRVQPGDGPQALGFQFTARKDVDLSQLKYAVRLYMPA